jgi:AraC-like DNA-binding protein
MLTLQDTIAVKPDDPFEHWHHVTCRKFSITESQRSSYRSFQSRVCIRDFGPLTISNIWSSTPSDESIRVTRRPSDIRKDPRDYFMLWLALDGEVTFSQAERVARLQPGDLVLHDQARPFVLEFSERSHAMMISIPRPLLLSRIPTAPQLTARRVAGRSNLGLLAGSVASQLARLEGAIHEETVRKLSTSAIDIFSTSLETELAGPTDLDRAHERLDKVKSYMLANLHDCEMDLDTIAKAQNTGVRTLNRLFASEGTTPIRWLWQQRLMASFTALAEGRVHQVTEAALTCGFTDLSHFSRAFKAAFGRSPQDVMPRRLVRS